MAITKINGRQLLDKSITGNKIADGTITLEKLADDILAVNEASSLATTGASVIVALAAPPTVGQVLTATSATNATWQTPSSGSISGSGVASSVAIFSGTNAITNQIVDPGTGPSLADLLLAGTPAGNFGYAGQAVSISGGSSFSANGGQVTVSGAAITGLSNNVIDGGQISLLAGSEGGVQAARLYLVGGHHDTSNGVQFGGDVSLASGWTGSYFGSRLSLSAEGKRSVPDPQVGGDAVLEGGVINPGNSNNGSVILRTDQADRLTVGPDGKVKIVGPFQVQSGSQGTSKVLVSDASGLTTWAKIVTSGGEVLVEFLTGDVIFA